VCSFSLLKGKTNRQISEKMPSCQWMRFRVICSSS
jgi:hypothetical protein